MSFRYERKYTGKVKLIITDLAGTTVDYGSCAPAGAFLEMFSRQGVKVTDAQARVPMGMHKRDHIATMIAMPAIAEGWRDAHGGSDCTDADIDRMYAEFIPIQLEALPNYAKAIPGVIETLRQWRRGGLKVVATTGYNHEMMHVVVDGAVRQGMEFDLALCGGDVPKGRPAPWMIYRAMEAMNVYPPEAVVKIGDTIADIESGLNAGAWSVGVAKTGNMLGLPQVDVARLSPDDLAAKLEVAYAKMYQAGAHFVVDGVEDCPAIIDQINAAQAGA
jgi:phosphonoacetaldehyde hydrolase